MEDIAALLRWELIDDDWYHNTMVNLTNQVIFRLHSALISLCTDDDLIITISVEQSMQPEVNTLQNTSTPEPLS